MKTFGRLKAVSGPARGVLLVVAICAVGGFSLGKMTHTPYGAFLQLKVLGKKLPFWSRVPSHAGGASKSSGGLSDFSPPANFSAELTDMNVALDENGGAIESISGTVDPSTQFYGPGYNGRRLIDGKNDPAWTGDNEHPEDTSPLNVIPGIPLEIVLSFYRHQSALVGAVAISPSEDLTKAPKDVEIWISNTSPSDGFQKAGGGTLPADAGEHEITFSPVEARYLKVLVLSNQQGGVDGSTNKPTLEIAEIRVLESRRAGYASIRDRNPDLPRWKGSPRYAAQRGIEWLQPASIAWQQWNTCYGCHIQSQVVMGLAVAKKNGYIVDDQAAINLAKFTETQQKPDGSYDREGEGSTAFAGMGMAYWDDWKGIKQDPALLKAADFLLAKQDPSGQLPYGQDEEHAVALGSLVHTANTLTAFRRAYDESNDARYKTAADRALAWIATASAVTTQDKVFKILALARFGGDANKSVVEQLVEQLTAEQTVNGGWRENTTDFKEPNPFSTGQVLYAFKQAGVSVNSSSFMKGVQYLLGSQEVDGSWKVDQTVMHTQGARYPPSMWATIGLAGAFGDVTAGTSELEVQKIQTVEKGCTRQLTVGSDALFAFNEATLTSTAQETLAALGPEVKNAGQHPVQINGYTDSIGSEKYNQLLSEQRARSVRDWLAAHHYLAAGTPIKGFGKQNPVAPNTNPDGSDNPTGRGKNRRVEVLIDTCK